MTDQATRDADRELDLALDAELRADTQARNRKTFIEQIDRSIPPVSEEARNNLIADYDDINRTWQGDRVQRDPADLKDMGRDGVVGRLGDYSRIDDPEHRAKLDATFAKLQTSLEDGRSNAAAEERAKKRMEARQAFTQRLKTRIRAFLFAVWSLVFLCIVGAGVWGYYNFKTIVPAWDKYTSAQKNCIFKVGERTVTGTRTVSYRYYQILDWRAHDESTVETETRLDVSGNGMTVIQYVNGKPEKLAISDGEKYRQLLTPAEKYSFFMDNGKNFAELSFNDICR
jgi:hypothetical protein